MRQALEWPARTQEADRVIAIAASAGGVNALRLLLAGLPSSMPAGVVVVLHLDSQRPSYLQEILGWYTALAVEEARHRALLRPGTVYVSPPGVHLLVGVDHRLVISHLPPVNFCRPSADRLFGSLGPSYGSHGIAVILTGRGTDGALGAQEMRRHGGTVIVQDEASSEFPGMPLAAMHAGRVDRVLPLKAIAGTLKELVGVGALS